MPTPRIKAALLASLITAAQPAFVLAAPCGPPGWEQAPAWICHGSGAAQEDRRGRLLVGVESYEVRDDVEQAISFAAARASHELWRAWASYLNLLRLEVHGARLVQGEDWAPPPWSPSGEPIAGATVETWVTPDARKVFARASVSIERAIGYFAERNREDRSRALRKLADAVHESLARRDRAPVEGPRAPGWIVKQVAVGSTHGCAVLADERLACWGTNEYGEVGQRRLAEAQAPVPRVVPGLERVAGVSAGTNFTCAWTTSGEVYCFGVGHHGQLGYDAEDRCSDANLAYLSCSSTPRKVGLRDVVQVAAGASHACALGREGSVHCWGAGEYGQLGSAPTGSCIVTNPRSSWSVPCSRWPVEVPGIEGAKQLAAGYDHTCAVTTGGRVRCWGNNALGQLGPRQGTYDCPRAGAPCTYRAGSVSGVSDAVGVVAGHWFTCAWRADGTATCWGDDSRGQLGAAPGPRCTDGTYAACARAPTLVSNLADVAGMCAGTHNACAVHRDGGVSCWGASGPVLGLRDVASREAIGYGRPPRRIDVSTPVAQIDCEAVICGRSRTGEALCWGRNITGNVGDGTVVARHTPGWVRFEGVAPAPVTTERPAEVPAGSR